MEYNCYYGFYLECICSSRSVWVAWVQIKLLKGKSFWAVKTPQSST